MNGHKMILNKNLDFRLVRYKILLIFTNVQKNYHITKDKIDQKEYKIQLFRMFLHLAKKVYKNTLFILIYSKQRGSQFKNRD